MPEDFFNFETLANLVPYTPLLVFVAAFVDVFFLTGLFLYGGAMVIGVIALIVSGLITPAEVVVAASLGTLFGSTLNFCAGYFGSQHPTIQKFLKKPGANKVRNFLVKRNLPVTILIARFITLARPLYGVVLGALRVSPRRFFMYEIPIVIFWVILWLVVLLQGEMLFRYFFMN